MKNVELKKRFKNKYVIRVAAGAVTIAVIGTGAGVYTVHAQKAVQSQETESEADADGEADTEAEDKAEQEEVKDKLSEVLSGEAKSAEDAGKEETVYVVANADGSADNVIVSEWLKNKDGSDTLKDASDLKDITNVKGDETFTQNGDEITWDAKGKDIYYQGTTDKELPVTEKITYYLDGQEMTPEEIAGKSGKVTIRFDYTNNEKTTRVVDGEEHEVYVPFTVMTGMILPEDYSNVEVTNGKVISDGSKKVVVGVAMPGLKDSLAIEDGDLDEEVEIPDYVEITADVENFSLDMTMSVIMNDLLGSANLDDAFDLSGLEDSIDTLSDSSKQLVDGSEDLAEGLETLKSSMKEFASGVNTLKNGITSYTDGASEINNGAAALSNGINSMSQGVNSLTSALGTAMSDSEKQAVAAQADAAVESTFAGGMSDAVAAQAAEQFAAAIKGNKALIGESLCNSELYTTMVDAIYNQKIFEAYQAQKATVDAAIAQYAASGVTVSITDVVETGYQQQTGHTIKSEVEAGVQQQLKENVAGQITTGIAESGKAAMGANVADACKTAAKTAAESAAVSGAEGAKSQIAAQLQQSGLMEGVAQLQSGADQLAQGSSTLVSNNGALLSGASALADATSQLTNGVDKLADGSDELMEGMAKFDAEGIQKLVDAYNGDAKALLNKLTAVVDAGKDYQTFTKVSDGTTGTVKFILRTEAVKADEE